MFSTGVFEKREKRDFFDFLDTLPPKRLIIRFINNPEQLGMYIEHKPDFFRGLDDDQIFEICLINRECCEKMIQFFKKEDGKEEVVKRLERHLDNIKTLPLCQAKC